MIAPIDIECPTCKAPVGGKCHTRFVTRQPFFGPTTLTPDERGFHLDYHHSARVDAAFRVNVEDPIDITKIPVAAGGAIGPVYEVGTSDGKDNGLRVLSEQEIYHAAELARLLGCIRERNLALVECLEAIGHYNKDKHGDQEFMSEMRVAELLQLVGR